MKRFNVAFLVLLSFLVSVPAYALSLNEARANGGVGEGRDGYVVALSKSSAMEKFADSINAKRKAEYMRISKENGQPVGVVAKLAAEQIINKLPKGAKYQNASGNWVSK
ncbi:MAG: YdbL family protein [Rickettsiales bacterium]